MISMLTKNQGNTPIHTAERRKERKGGIYLGMNATKKVKDPPIKTLKLRKTLR